MNIKTIMTLTFLLILTSLFSTVAFSQALVGVKQGDWIEYNVTFTGSPPVEHDVVWARMEILGVKGSKVNATFVSRLANGTILNVIEDIDLETGRLIDLFVIPAGLNVGDSFYDRVAGRIEIDRVEVRTYAGAARSVVHAVAVDTQWYWDQLTGLTLEARTANSVYTLDTIAYSTNLWSPQILGLDPTVFYSLTILIAGIIIAAVLIFLKRRHANNPQVR